MIIAKETPNTKSIIKSIEKEMNIEPGHIVIHADYGGFIDFSIRTDCTATYWSANITPTGKKVVKNSFRLQV